MSEKQFAGKSAIVTGLLPISNSTIDRRETLCCIDSRTSNNKLIEKFSGGNYFEFRHYFLQKRVVADVVGNNEAFVHKGTAGNQSVVL